MMTPREVVQALRDAAKADVKQTFSTLVLLTHDGPKYCALGAILHQAGATDEQINNQEGDGGYGLFKKLGIDLDGWTLEDFYRRNDGGWYNHEMNGPKTFEEIADEFEAHLDKIEAKAATE